MSNDPKRSKSARRNGRGGAKQSNQRSPQQPQKRGDVLATARRHYERYVALAQDAAAGGDPIEAENFYQHAEHYLRTLREHSGGGRDDGLAEAGFPPA